MNINNISLPYPVLGISDDILPMLPADAVDVSVAEDKRNFTFTINLKFDNDDIEYLILDGKAEYSCEYDCPRTMLRACVKSAEPHLVITLPRTAIFKRLNFNCFVSVKAPILGYANSGFNIDYEGAAFDMEPGDVLVAFPQFHYDVDIKYDKLQAAGSFMQIRETNLYKEVRFNIAGDKIEILMPTQLFHLYGDSAVKGAAEIVHASLVLNALTYALLHIEDHEQTTWAKSIRYRLAHEDGFTEEELEDPDNVPAVAGRLLKDPYTRLFNHIKANTNTED